MTRRLALAAVSAVLLAGCGSTTTISTTTPTPSARRFCSGLTDTCRTLPSVKRGFSLQSAKGRIPDVSSYQGHPDWAAAKRAGIAGGIFKGGEYSLDPTAAYNAHALAALHLWHAMYWFVRNTGCSHEAAQIIAAAHAYGVLVVVNDLEVREAAGYGACLVPAERRAHLIAVDYTGPGTFPGGGFGLAPLWQAEYGPTLHAFWHPVLAWQCTDGAVGCVTLVPGIGVDDVSLDLGITKLGAGPAPVQCFGQHAQLRDSKCRRLRPLVAKRSRARASTVRALIAKGCARKPSPTDTRALAKYLSHARHTAACAVLLQRAVWFNEAIQRNLGGNAR